MDVSVFLSAEVAALGGECGRAAEVEEAVLEGDCDAAGALHAHL